MNGPVYFFLAVATVTATLTVLWARHRKASR